VIPRQTDGVFNISLSSPNKTASIYRRAGSDWKVFSEVDIIFISIFVIKIPAAKRGETDFVGRWKAER
jgi:hypothetical protein